jgi:DNA-binding NarL/FixJ family response regulator
MPRAVGKQTIFDRRMLRVLLLDLDNGETHANLTSIALLRVTRVRSFDEANLALAAAAPDAAVVALARPEADDVVALKQFVRVAGSVPVLVISEPVADEQTVRLIKAGAGGYLYAGESQDLVARLYELIKGGIPMSQPILQVVLQRARRSSAQMAAVRPGTDGGRSLLTERQCEILKLLQLGHSYDDIGVALGLSVNTVRTHLRTIYERLGASTKVEAVMIAMELGILERTRLSERPPPTG